MSTTDPTVVTEPVAAPPILSTGALPDETTVDAAMGGGETMGRSVSASLSSRGGRLIVLALVFMWTIPTFGLLIYLVVLISPKIHSKGELPYLLPTEIVLVLLAIPPILTSTYSGVQNVDLDVRDAAKGMGMTGSQVVRKVELPNALPLVLSGTRSATLQVIATATVAAYVTLGGLGRYLVDGLSQLNDPHAGYPAMAAGAILVALLAIVADLLFAIAQRFLVPRGVSGRFPSAAKAAAPTSVSAGPVEVTVGPS